jgi:hypothetical protein
LICSYIYIYIYLYLYLITSSYFKLDRSIVRDKSINNNEFGDTSDDDCSRSPDCNNENEKNIFNILKEKLVNISTTTSQLNEAITKLSKYLFHYKM